MDENILTCLITCITQLITTLITVGVTIFVAYRTYCTEYCIFLSGIRSRVIPRSFIISPMIFIPFSVFS